jgi:sporulation protein YlmC with PRC-barrel domain
VRLSDLLGLEVRSESGEHLGQVHDVRGDLGTQGLRVTVLVVGHTGILERLGIGAPHTQTRMRAHAVIPWESVIRADRRGVVVRDTTASRAGSGSSSDR